MEAPIYQASWTIPCCWPTGRLSCRWRELRQPVVLDWNGDGFDDIVVTSHPSDPNSTIDVARIYSGKVIAESPTSVVNETSAQLLHIRPDSTDPEDEMAAIFGANWQSLGISIYGFNNVGSTASVAGDFNGDGLQDLLLEQQDYIDITIGPITDAETFGTRVSGAWSGHAVGFRPA